MPIIFSKVKREIRKKKLRPEFEEEILLYLDKKENEIKELKNFFDSKRNLSNFTHLKRRFPLFHDHFIYLKKFNDYPNLVFSILLTEFLKEKMNFFYKELCYQVRELNKYLLGKKSDEGERVYRFLFKNGRRGIDEKILRRELKRATRKIDMELSDYQNESDVYESRDINKEGLITNDAVKCLKDFKGRTFPFLRTICARVKKGYKVLEVGVGTGIFSIISIIAGAKKVVGVELNPITCILAGIIIDYLEYNGVIPKNSVEILWGDALKLGTQEYREFNGKKFDVLISENIYTGMFYELQMKMISQVIRNNLLPSKRVLAYGFYLLGTDAVVIPEGMSSCVELVELSKHNFKKPTEVLLDLKKQGVRARKLTKDHVYDQIDFRVDEFRSIVSLVKFKILRKGKIDAVNVYSTIRMMEGDYIDRNENKFLNNDSLLLLNNPVQVNKGDLIIMGLAYNEGDSVSDIVLEIRKLNKDGTVNRKYDARLNIPEWRHRRNIRNFEKKNKCKYPINLLEMGDFELVRSSSFYRGYERLWLSDIDYKNIKAYGV